MSGLPEFDLWHGYLPTGLHPATHDEIRDRCVNFDAWGREHREKLFSGYEKLIAALELVGLPTEHWIGGSFVSKAETPGDIDIVNYCDVQAYEGLPPELMAMIKRYFQGEETAKHCHCDSYFVPMPPPEHRHKEEFLIVRAYWEKELGHDTEGRKKGIISRQVEFQDTVSPLEEDHAGVT